MELLSTGDVARLLNVGTQRVRQLERAQKLQAVRTAGGWRLFNRERTKI